MYRNGPSTPPCGTPLPGVTHSVHPFPCGDCVPSCAQVLPNKITVREPQLSPYLLFEPVRCVGERPCTSTDAINVSSSSSSKYMSYMKLASFVDLPGTDPHILSGMTPAAYSRRCILPKTTIHTSLAHVTAQHMGLQFPGLR